MPDYLALPLIAGLATIYFWSVKTGLFLRHIWPINGALAAVFWAVTLLSGPVDWPLAALAGYSGIILTLAAVRGR